MSNLYLKQWYFPQQFNVIKFWKMAEFLKAFPFTDWTVPQRDLTQASKIFPNHLILFFDFSQRYVQHVQHLVQKTWYTWHLHRQKPAIFTSYHKFSFQIVKQGQNNFYCFKWRSYHFRYFCFRWLWLNLPSYWCDGIPLLFSLSLDSYKEIFPYCKEWILVHITNL